MTSHTMPQVCFVFGALRSGTTMFRLMLNNHPQISNPGEVDFLFDFLHPTPSADWRYDKTGLRANRIFMDTGLSLPHDLDGLPLLHHMINSLRGGADRVLTLNVHRNAARIAAALPEAKFIHLLRDGRDVAYSSIGMGWVGNAYFGVDHWLRTEAGWREAASNIAPERTHTLAFESLMQDIEPRLRAVCTFLEVPFDAQMLAYHENSSYGPPDPRIAQQWKRKADPHMIALIEGKAAATLRDLGYDVAGQPRYPGAVERVRLSAENRVRRWQFNLRRFGPMLFFKTAVAKVSGSPTLRARVQKQRNDRIARLLK